MCGVPVFVSVDNVWLSLGGRLLNLDLCLLLLLFISCQSVTARLTPKPKKLMHTTLLLGLFGTKPLQFSEVGETPLLFAYFEICHCNS
jgi:hypothetical protein